MSEIKSCETCRDHGNCDGEIHGYGNCWQLKSAPVKASTEEIMPLIKIPSAKTINTMSGAEAHNVLLTAQRDADMLRHEAAKKEWADWLGKWRKTFAIFPKTDISSLSELDAYIDDLTG